MRWKMCDRGRKLSVVSASVIGSSRRHTRTLEPMFPWVSSTPLGLPVVPEV